MASLIRITVLTPKNQAAKCIESQKKAMLGHAQSKKVIDQKLIAHNKFYWDVSYETDKEYFDIVAKCSRGEVMIKRFYKTLFKVINRANNLANKFDKGIKWIKSWIIKRIKKIYVNNPDMEEYINNMTDDEMKDYLKIDDRAEMEKLLEKDLIKIKIIV